MYEFICWLSQVLFSFQSIWGTYNRFLVESMSVRLCVIWFTSKWCVAGQPSGKTVLAQQLLPSVWLFDDKLVNLWLLLRLCAVSTYFIYFAGVTSAFIETLVDYCAFVWLGEFALIPLGKTSSTFYLLAFFEEKLHLQRCRARASVNWRVCFFRIYIERDSSSLVLIIKFKYVA